MTRLKLKIISCTVLWRELCYHAALSRHEFSFHFLPWGLHTEPNKLRQEVQQAVDATTEPVDAILLGYGLCSRGLDGIAARNAPLVITRAHDCITCFLGSRERYRTYFDANPGTYWYTPGWIENHLSPGKERYEANYRDYLEKYGEDNAQYLMEMEQGWFREYSTAAYVDLGIGDTKAHEDYTRQCAEWLEWRFDRLEGDSALIRRLVDGSWEGGEFLVVSAGHRIEATNDESIMRAVPA